MVWKIDLTKVFGPGGKKAEVIASYEKGFKDGYGSRVQYSASKLALHMQRMFPPSGEDPRRYKIAGYDPKTGELARMGQRKEYVYDLSEIPELFADIQDGILQAKANQDTAKAAYNLGYSLGKYSFIADCCGGLANSTHIHAGVAAYGSYLAIFEKNNKPIADAIGRCLGKENAMTISGYLIAAEAKADASHKKTLAMMAAQIEAA